MKNKLINIFLILALVAGLSLLIYPTVSDYWNSLHASQAVASYDQAVKSMDEGKYDELLQRAGQYNRDLFLRGTLFALTDEEREDYNSQLDIDGSGVMGYIEIPTIKVSLPIYHGTSDDVLQVAVGHLEWSSLPVGGESTHCVLSGHRGLPSAKLFTNLDQLTEGDLFVIRTLDEVLTYEVDRILIVLPSELQALAAEEGKDLCTLVTCTPYGVNSHRMLVRGHRVDNQSEAVRLTADAIRIDPLLVAPIAAIPLLLALLLLLAAAPKKKSFFVGGDAHIAPAIRTVFTKIQCEFVTSLGSMCSIDPYELF